MKTYADLLRGRIFHTEQEAKEHLKSDNDSIFWWESNQIWGYTTKELVKESISNAKEDDNKIKKSLMQMCEFLRMDGNKQRCDTFHKGETVAEFIGLNS